MFQLFNFPTPQPVPIQVPFSNWIYAANDEVMYEKSKK